MKAFVLNIAVWGILLNAFQFHVNGQVTNEDVAKLRKKISELKRVLSDVAAKTKQAETLFKMYQNSTVNVETAQIKLKKNSRIECDRQVGKSKNYVHKYIGLLKKKQISRVNGFVKKLEDSFAKTRDIFKSFRVTVTVTARNASDLRKQNTAAAEMRQEYMSTIRNGLVDRSSGSLENGIFVANRQLQLQQFSQFERTRSNGYSGIKQIRSTDSKIEFVFLYFILRYEQCKSLFCY